MSYFGKYEQDADNGNIWHTVTEAERAITGESSYTQPKLVQFEMTFDRDNLTSSYQCGYYYSKGGKRSFMDLSDQYKFDEPNMMCVPIVDATYAPPAPVAKENVPQTVAQIKEDVKKLKDQGKDKEPKPFPWKYVYWGGGFLGAGLLLWSMFGGKK